MTVLGGGEGSASLHQDRKWLRASYHLDVVVDASHHLAAVHDRLEHGRLLSRVTLVDGAHLQKYKSLL